MGDLEGQNGTYVFREELDDKLVMGCPNEGKSAGPGEFDEKVHPV